MRRQLGGAVRVELTGLLEDEALGDFWADLVSVAQVELELLLRDRLLNENALIRWLFGGGDVSQL